MSFPALFTLDADFHKEFYISFLSRKADVRTGIHISYKYTDPQANFGNIHHIHAFRADGHGTPQACTQPMHTMDFYR